MKKLTLLIAGLGTAIMGLTYGPIQGKTMVKDAIGAPTKGTPLFSYGLINFKTLPDITILEEAKVTSLNHVDGKTIYGHVEDYSALQNISGFESFEILPAKYKLSEPIIEYAERNLAEKIHTFIYLPADLSPDGVTTFCENNGIENVGSESLPHYMIMTELNAEEINSLKEKELVSWISKAPVYAVEGRPFHFCPGMLTDYGPRGEFARWVTLSPGWDGEGLGCANLTYFFENGTPDLAGNLEHEEVIRAMRTWEKYVQINFTEAEMVGLFDGIDISWGAEDHGDPFPFDGPFGVLAHAAGPNPPNGETFAGDVHFDEDETWTVGGAVDLYSVALHEIGHSIGLDHSAVTDAVMFGTYSLGTEHTDLHEDDIEGIRSIYAGRWIQEDEWDHTFVGNVTGDSDKEIVMVNASYNGGAIRVDDLVTGDNLLWINHCDHQGWMDKTDKMFLADANGDGLKDLVLVNTDYVDGAIRSIDLTTGASLSWIMHGVYGGWMDATDKMFVGNTNGDPQEELILVNTGYTGGAIRSVNILTGATVSQLNHTGTYNGWMDASDRMLLGDADNNNEMDLILINTSYTGGAIRTVDIGSGTNLGWLNHTGTYNGWMDVTDKVAVADIDNSGEDALILVNTSYTGGAIRAVDLQTGAGLSWINHGPYGNWMDGCDRMFITDVNNDNEEDLVLVNTTYSGGAIRSIDISSGSSISWLWHGTYGGWMDAADRMFCEDINSDGRGEVIMVNTGYTGGAIRTTTVTSGTNLSWLMHTGWYNGWMDGTSKDQNCFYNPVFKSTNQDAGESPGAVLETLPESNPMSTLNLEIYPNPAQNEINISIIGLTNDQAILEVYNLEGKQVLSPRNIQSGVNTLQVTDLINGFYLVKITDGETVLHQKIQVIK